MTEFIRQERLLDPAEVDAIVALAPQFLMRWQDAVADSEAPRPEMRRWLTVFDAFAGDPSRIDTAPGLYDGVRGQP